MASRESVLLVAIQFTGLGLTCLSLKAVTPGSRWWLVFCGVGVLLGIFTLMHNRIGNFSVFPELTGRAQLITTGPYRLVRHPMYCALALVSLGLAISNGHWLNSLGLAMVFGAILLKAKREELILHKRFTDYADYAARTRRFVPFVY